MTMKSLHIAPDLSLPIDAATRRMAILAMSGAGKSSLAVLIAEQMFDAGIPWVAIDPKGDWWGIRSSKSGKGAGLPIPIFGGLHADVRIDPTAAAGAELAEVIAAERMTCVVDISEFVDRQAMWAFLAAFGDKLLHRNRTALHLFLEEADEYLPQSTKEKGNLPRCLGVWQRVVKRGRFRGIGSTQITQRNASLNKDTLYQAECLFALRATGKGDRAAVKGWVEYHSAAAEIVDSLPSLEDGEGWISSPAWLKTTARTRFHRRRTFDSGATPVLLEADAKPATLATIDLGAIQRRMTATIERAKAEDPRELQKQIAEMKRQMAKGPDVRVIETTTRELKEASERFDKIIRERDLTIDVMKKILNRLESQEVPRYAPVPRFAPPLPAPRKNTAIERTESQPAGDADLGKGERAILAVLAQYPHGKNRRALGTLSGYSSSGGSFGTYLSRLRGKGLIEGSDVIRATAAGLAALGDFDPLPRGEELQRYWLDRLGKGEAAILRVLLERYPDTLSRDELGHLSGYEASGGSFGTYLSRLRTKELIDERELRASEAFFE